MNNPRWRLLREDWLPRQVQPMLFAWALRPEARSDGLLRDAAATPGGCAAPA